LKTRSPSFAVLFVLLIFLCESAVLVQAATGEKVPLLKRGPRAWENYSSYPTHFVNRLHVHAVDDQTNRVYAKQVKRFLNHAKIMGESPSSTREWDVCMADELASRCYGDRESVSSGQCLFHGWSHIFPSFKGRMPESYRALQAWQKLDTGGVGGPVGWGVLLILICRLFERGLVYQGLWIWLQHDIYGREQDCEMITSDDIYIDPGDLHSVAVQLGTRARGLSVKTGSDQGVQIDEAALALILGRIKRTMRPGEPLFHFSQTTMRKYWTEEQLRAGILHPFKMHSIRHSKPSADAASGRRSLEAIRRRGRWSQLKSVQRYSRGHALTMHWASLPELIASQARTLESVYPGPLVSALRRGPGRETVLGKIILDVLESDVSGRDARTSFPRA
jgi:hypothetical protein